MACSAPTMVDAHPRSPFDSGSVLGKRYVSVDGAFEVLCVKQGEGTLAFDGMPLALKEPKPLPSSD
jgi:hypothetical protein